MHGECPPLSLFLFLSIYLLDCHSKSTQLPEGSPRSPVQPVPEPVHLPDRPQGPTKQQRERRKERNERKKGRAKGEGGWGLRENNSTLDILACQYWLIHTSSPDLIPSIAFSCHIVFRLLYPWLESTSWFDLDNWNTSEGERLQFCYGK